MPDATGSPEVTTPARHEAEPHANRDAVLGQPFSPATQPAEGPSAQPATASAPAPMDWTPAIEKLRAVRDDPAFQQAQPQLTRRVEKLLSDIGDGAPLQDGQAPTWIAYLVSDIDRATEASLVLPPDLRSEVDRLAVSYPRLDHPDIQDMLRQTASMTASDHQTIRDVRLLARDYVKHDRAAEPSGTADVMAERIRVMESRVRDALAGPEAPPRSEIPEHERTNEPKPATATEASQQQRSQPQASEPQQPPGAQPQTDARQQANHAQIQQDIQPQDGRQGQGQQTRQTPGTVNVPMSPASHILSQLAQAGTGGPPPWQGLTQAISSRLETYQQAQADRYHRDLERTVEASGKAAVKALAALDTGPAADVMRKIGQEAGKDPNGATGVIEQMRPGGKHETLRNEFNAVIAQANGFGATFDRTKAALADYLDNRNALAENYHRRGWNAGDLDRKLGDTDRAIAGVAERTPGRESGKSISEELAKKAMALAEALYEKVRQTFGRTQSAASPEATPAASPSAVMSPTP